MQRFKVGDRIRLTRKDPSMGEYGIHREEWQKEHTITFVEEGERKCPNTGQRRYRFKRNQENPPIDYWWVLESMIEPAAPIDKRAMVPYRVFYKTQTPYTSWFKTGPGLPEFLVECFGTDKETVTVVRDDPNNFVFTHNGGEVTFLNVEGREQP